MKNELKKKGFDVYSVPEAITIALSNGAIYPNSDSRQLVEEFQNIVFEFQLSLEETFFHLATMQHERPAIIIYDRGIFDIKPCVDDTVWNTLLQRYHTDEASLRERYDLVCHLVSAADGAESHYSAHTNSTISSAKELDQKTQTAWQDHPNHHIIDNHYATFELKLQGLLEVVETFAMNRLTK